MIFPKSFYFFQNSQMFLFCLLIALVAGSELTSGWWRFNASVTKHQPRVYIQVYQTMILDGWYATPDQTSYPLNGLYSTPINSANDQMVSFCVLWQNGLPTTPGITTWNGRYKPATNTIEASWTSWIYSAASSLMTTGNVTLYGQ